MLAAISMGVTSRGRWATATSRRVSYSIVLTPNPQ